MSELKEVYTYEQHCCKKAQISHGDKDKNDNQLYYCRCVNGYVTKDCIATNAKRAECHFEGREK